MTVLYTPRDEWEARDIEDEAKALREGRGKCLLVTWLVTIMAAFAMGWLL